ncbi:MAG TPA: glycosyltransferase family 4 protein [Chthonomonadales bacterium]|nr:glycosyltransferase family 4 protein [Chthonomonadales bacterium]
MASVRPVSQEQIGANGHHNVSGYRPVKNPRTLMLIPSYAKRGIEKEVAANEHPQMDYYALQAELEADLADYAVLDADRHPLVRAARKLGKDVGLAMHGFLRRNNYDVIYSNGENVSIPLAALFRLARQRPRHVLIGHHLSPKKKRPFLRVLHPQMDAIFVYARTQYEYAQQALGIPAWKLHLIPFHADHRFYHPMRVPVRNMICSAGLEWRDYPTMIEAVRGLDVEVCLAAASPWSKHKNETAGRTLPPNVSARCYNYTELRQLYAESCLVVVPLYDNDFQAGVTTLLEAMAMGKAVLVTRTVGQRDVIEDGENGVYVPPGDPAAMRDAILRLLNNPQEAARLGKNARKTIEENMTLDHWAQRIATVTRTVVSEIV